MKMRQMQKREHAAGCREKPECERKMGKQVVGISTSSTAVFVKRMRYQHRDCSLTGTGIDT